MPAESELTKICHRLIDDCQEGLKCSTNGLEDDQVVHELRVATKRLRAAWKMVSGQVPKALRKSRAAELRRLSAMLAGGRDLFVLETLSRDLQATHPKAPFQEVLDHLSENFVVNEEVGSAEQVQLILEEEKAAWGKMSFESFAGEQDSHRHAVRKTHRKARQATREALANRSAEVWHDWRKRVKALRYQREFLAEIQGRTPGKLDARISRLGSRLGDRNDLANLTTIAEQLGNPPALRKAIAAEENGILGNCRRLGRRNFL